MSSVDDRIVNMQFNNKQFESGVSTSTKSLNDLEKTLANTAKSKGLDTFAGSVEGVTGKFSAMRIAGITAIATIANKAVNAGLKLLKSLTLDPVMDGFQEYQTGLQSVQTIMANTGKPVKAVNKALDQLNKYADKTIYNFGQMAKNVGTFTAAGVDLKTSVQSIKGIANLAALSGSSAQQASGAMYQLSQAIAAGKVGLQDWNSVVNAGMGGKVFQTALARTAENMGTLSKGAVEMVGPMDKLTIAGESFRTSIQAGGKEPPWLTSEVLVDTLKQVAGGYSEAELRAKGFSKAQANAIVEMQKRAFDAATQIKTLPQLIGVIRENIGSSFSNIFRTVLGDFKQSKKLWTDVGFVIMGPNGFLTRAEDKLEGFVKRWAELGGRTKALEAIKSILTSIGSVLQVIGSAFSEVFKSDKNRDAGYLWAITKAMSAFAKAIVPTQDTLENLRKIFGGVFAVMHIGASIVQAIATGFAAFFGEVFKGSGDAGGGILEFLGNIGELLIKLDDFLTSGGKMIDVMREIGHAAGVMTGGAIQMATDIISGLIQGIDIGASGLKDKIFSIGQSIIDWFKNVLGIHSPSVEMFEVGYNIAAGIGEGLIQGIVLIFKAIGAVGSFIKDAFNQLFGGMDALDWVAVMNALFTGSLILTMRSFVKNFGGIGKSITGTFDQMTDTLQTMQNSIRATIIMKIAIAVGVLTAALVVLSLLDPKKLAQGLGAIASMVGILVGAMAAMSKIGDEMSASFGKGKGAIAGGSVQILVMANAMSLMAGAMLILSAAVTILAQQDPKKIAIGIGAMATMMGIMVGALAGIAKIGPTVKGAAGAILIMATAMNIMAVSILALGNMSVETLAKGLGAIAIGLGLFVGAMLVFSKTSVGAEKAAGAIFIIASAMVVLATAVGILGNMDTKTLVKGFAAVAIGLALMVGSLLILSANVAGVLVVAQAMAMMSLALIGLAIAVGMFGNMDTGTLAKGFIAIALGLVLLIAAAAAATYVAPGLAILSTTFMALGLALALAGAGMFLFATGFALLTAAGIGGVAVLTAAFQAFMMLLPTFAIQIAAAFVSFIETIAAAAPRIREAMSTIFEQMLGVVTDAIPELAKLIQALISAAIGILQESIPQWVEMGMTVITEFVRSAAEHVPEIADAAGDLIVNFIRELDNHLQEIVDAGTDLIVNFLRGLGEAAVRITRAAGEFIVDLLEAIDHAVVIYMPQIRDVGLSIAGHILDGLTFGLAGNIGGVIQDAVRGAGNLPIVGELLGGRIAARGAPVSQTPKQAVAAATKMANAIIAQNNKVVLAAQKAASAAQKKADAAQAKADASRQAARRVAKSDPKLAKRLRAEAERQQKIADRVQSAADRARERVEKTREFELADLHQKGVIKDERAVELADRAREMLARANAEAAKARELMKTNRKAGQAMLDQAKKDAKEAKKLAAQSQASHAAAQKFYEQEVNERIKQLEEDRKADEEAARAQAEYDAATTAGKAEILNKRAEANEAKAAAAKAESLALIESAKALAATDATKAMELLDRAEEAAQIAQEAAAQAEQERDQAKQVLSQPSSSSGGGSIQPSRSVLEDAASVVDRYTASLAMAEQLAGATPQPIQFIQNNTSPEALSASEVYRQSKNLLSAAEIKMGVTSS